MTRNHTATAHQVSGRISTPTTGDVVAEHFQATGVVDGDVPPDRLWLVVDASGLWFPKEPPPTLSFDLQSWSGSVFGSIRIGRFDLVLISADSHGHHAIETWLVGGRCQGHYPGLRAIPGTQELDRISLLTR